MIASRNSLKRKHSSQGAVIKAPGKKMSKKR